MEREGTLWRHVGKGTFLAAQLDQARPIEISAVASRTSPGDVMLARTALEPAIARLAAGHASAADIAAVARRVAQAAAA